MSEKDVDVRFMKTATDSMWITREFESMPALALNNKLAEEFGEFAEALLVEQGYLQHKRDRIEGTFGEAADVIIVLLGVLAKHHRTMRPEEIKAQLADALERKNQKYINVLGIVDMEYIEQRKNNV